MALDTTLSPRRRAAIDLVSWAVVVVALLPIAVLALVLAPLDPDVRARHERRIRRFERTYGDPVSMLIAPYADPYLSPWLRFFQGPLFTAGVMALALVVLPVAIDLGREPDGLRFVAGSVLWLAVVQWPLRRRETSSPQPPFPWGVHLTIWAVGAAAIGVLFALDLHAPTPARDVFLGVVASAAANLAGVVWAVIAALVDDGAG